MEALYPSRSTQSLSTVLVGYSHLPAMRFMSLTSNEHIIPKGIDIVVASTTCRLQYSRSVLLVWESPSRQTWPPSCSLFLIPEQVNQDRHWREGKVPESVIYWFQIWDHCHCRFLGPYFCCRGRSLQKKRKKKKKKKKPLGTPSLKR